jgi:glycine cleavage system aminomethyltransferase T
VAAVKREGPTRRLRALVLDDPRSVVLGSEPVRVGGSVLGRITSGGYGYSTGSSIAYAYLPSEVVPGARVEIDLFGSWLGAEVVREPIFDPTGERVRA